MLTASADIIEPVRSAFRGLRGLEVAYVADRTTAGGELTNLYGAHRYFHTRGDGPDCVSAELAAPVAAAFRRAVAAALA